jgi:hypothetical protein
LQQGLLACIYLFKRASLKMGPRHGPNRCGGAKKMNSEVRLAVAKLREALNILDEQGEAWAAVHINQALEVLDPTAAFLPPEMELMQ